MNLYPISLSRLAILEANPFIQRFFKNVEDLKVDLKKDSDLSAHYESLQKKSIEFDKALLQIMAQEETMELGRLDLYRDQMLSSLRRMISVFQFSRNKKEQEAHHAATLVMDSYGNIEKASYEAESYGIQKLLEEWAKPERKDYMEILLLQPRLDLLKEANDAFNDLFNNRSATSVQKVHYDTQALKKQMLDAYRLLAGYTLGNAKGKKDNTLYVQVLEALNNGRKYFADQMARRDGGGGSPAPDVPKGE